MKIIFHMVLSVFIFSSIESVSPAVVPEYSSCYKCDSNVDEASCNEENQVGEKTDCVNIIPDPKGPLGCSISITTGGEKTRFVRDCVEVTSLVEFKCSNITIEEKNVYSCQCQGDFCNKNFETAKPKPPPKYSNCYSCDSNEDAATCNEESQFGETTDCVDIIPNPKGPLGCVITLTTGGETSHLERTCVEVGALDDFKCSNTTIGDDTVWSCKCQGDLCNKNFEDAKPKPPPQYSNCYSCDSNEDAATCNEESQFGETTDCVDIIPIPKGPLGCVITLTTGGETSHLERTCVEVGALDDFKCSNTTIGDDTVWSCKCQGDLCNKNFETARPDASTTTKPTPPISEKECYSCDSQEAGAPCDDWENAGVVIDCGAIKVQDGAFMGCKISKSESEGFQRIQRNCAMVEADEEFTCATETTDGESIHSCICKDDRCNFNWDTAGDTTGPTTTTTKPAKRYQCYSCNSNTGSCDEYDNFGKKDDCVDEIPVDGGFMGCQITKEVSDGKTFVVRSCYTTQHEEDFTCVTDKYRHTCSCQGDFCNKDWDSAGGNGTPSSHGQASLALLVTLCLFYIQSNRQHFN